MTHLTYTTLIAYVEQTLSPKTRDSVEAHLSSSCRQCQRRLIQVQTVLGALAGGVETATPPESAARRAMAIFPSQSVTTILQRIVATLLFDSYRQASLAAVRGAAHSRQLLFTAQDVDIDVQITTERNQTVVLGQMLSNTVELQPLSPVRLYRANEIIQTTQSDPHGQFAFREVPPGTYDLGVVLQSTEIVLTGLELAND